VCGGMVKDAQVELARLRVGGVAPCRLDGPRVNSDRALCRTRRLDEAQLVGISLAQARYGIGIGTSMISDVFAAQQAVQDATHVERGMCAQAFQSQGDRFV